MGEAALLLAMLLAQPVASGLDDLDGNRVPDSWFVRSSTTRRFEVLANGAVRFNSSAGSAGQCLLSNGASTPPSWGSCAGGAGGYTGISDEGSGLTSRATLNMVWRGNAAGLGGFLFMAQFGASTAVAQQRQLVGVKDATAVTGNVNPSTLLDVFYFGYDSAQTTWRVCGNDNAGAATCVDCGANFPVNATAAYEGWISADPNGSGIDYRLRRLDSAVADCSGTVSVSGDLPRNTVMLSTEAWINNGTTAAAAQLQLLQMWVAAPREL